MDGKNITAEYAENAEKIKGQKDRDLTAETRRNAEKAKRWGQENCC
jgi:hypothetical protein